MEVKRFFNRQWLFAFAFLAAGTWMFLKDSGVREIRRAVVDQGLTLADPVPASDDWPWWRGIGGRNFIDNSNLPVQWSVSENIVWKVSVPGRGHSSPCLWGERIFLSTSDAANQSISLLCFDRQTGHTKWQSELHRGGFGECHQKNSHASATPACDGQFVYVVSPVKGSLWVTAVDFSGQIAWSCEAGPYSAEWGYGSSPAIHKSLVIVAADNRGSGVDRLIGSSWLAAMNRQTGDIIWRIKRTEGDSFGSPVVARVSDRDQLLLAGKDCVNSYDPATGDVLWTCRWPVKRTANSVAFDDQHVFASARQPHDEMVCIRADGSGDVTGTHIVWREQKSASDVPSLCVRDGRLYSLGDDGILTCLDVTNGKQIWKRRLGGNMSASPLIAGDHLYCCNEEGTTYVVNLSRRGEVISENAIGDGIMASPVAGQNLLYIRTTSGLYCLTAERSAPLANQTDGSPRRL